MNDDVDCRLSCGYWNSKRRRIGKAGGQNGDSGRRGKGKNETEPGSIGKNVSETVASYAMEH